MALALLGLMGGLVALVVSLATNARSGAPGLAQIEQTTYPGMPTNTSPVYPGPGTSTATGDAYPAPQTSTPTLTGAQLTASYTPTLSGPLPASQPQRSENQLQERRFLPSSRLCPA